MSEDIINDDCPACGHDIKLHNNYFNGHATRIYCLVGSFSEDGCCCDGFNKITLRRIEG